MARNYLEYLKGIDPKGSVIPIHLRDKETFDYAFEIDRRTKYLKFVKNYGAVGDGVTNDTAAFNAAIADTSGGFIFITDGEYIIDADIDGADNVFIVSNATISNPIMGKTLYITNSVNGSNNVGIGNVSNWQTNSVMKLGGQYMDAGLQIGSANPNHATKGMNIYSDGHSDYLAFKPSTVLEQSELNLYDYAITGEIQTVSGTNRVVAFNATWTSLPYTDDLIGLPIYISGFEPLKITNVINDTTLEVGNYDGSSLVFNSAEVKDYSIVIATYDGTINVNGSSVELISGQPFLGYLTNPHSCFKINGTIYTINSIQDEKHLTLNENAGSLTNAHYRAYGDVEGEASAVRINMACGEQLTLQANAKDKCFYISHYYRINSGKKNL